MSRPFPILLALLAGIALGVVVGLALDGRESLASFAGGDLVVRADGAAPARPSRKPLAADSATSSSGTRSAGILDPAALDPLLLVQAEGLAQDALAEVSAAPAIVVPSGTQAIYGTVLDHLGQPIHGAVVYTWGASKVRDVFRYSHDYRGRGWPGPADLAASLRDQASSKLESRARGRETVTGEDGRFSLEGLTAGKFKLKAYAEGQIFSTKTVPAGGSAHFVGKRVRLFDLLVEREDGTPIESAVIEVGKSNAVRRYDWTSDESVLRLEEAADWFRVLSGHVVNPTRGAIFADLVSERRWVDLKTHGDGPHRFVLKPTRSLAVTVVDQATASPRPLPTLAYVSSSRLRKAGGRTEFSRVCTKMKADNDGVFRVMELAKGDYLLGVGRNRGEPIVFREFTMGMGNVRETVELPSLDRSRYHVVNVQGPDGTPLPGASFTRWAWTNGKHVAQSYLCTERQPGEYWLPRRRPLPSPRLVTSVPGWGSVIQPAPEGSGELTVTFQRPCQLTVRVAGSTDLMHEVTARNVAPVADGSVRSLARSKEGFTDPRGEVRLHGLQPGRAQITVESGKPRSEPDGSTETVAIELVSVRSGEQRITVTPEALYELEVHAPSESPGLDLRLHPMVDVDSNLIAPWGHPGKLDARGRAIFQGLKAGSYELAAGGRVPRVVVTVPSGTVRYQRPSLFGYEPRRRRAESTLAPFQAADIVTAIDGESVTTGEFSWRVGLALDDPPVEITVFRQGREQVIEVVHWPTDVSYTPVAAPTGE